ncbi:DUF3577 domain-containing protein [Denitratimonas sp. CY0512]|uniref:DUF3577 domain-containing protein n=1 Tax=Denitratimonas sp. CY0512 TaxID=3131940 RepID=UPI0030B43B94
MSTATNNFHNTALRGPAYLNDVRMVTPKGSRRGEPYLAARVKFLQGAKNPAQGDPDEGFLVNCNIQGPAAELLNQYAGSESQIWAVVRVSNLSSSIYTRSKDSKYGKAGDPAIANYGRLYAVEQMYVDGNKVYSRTDEAAEADSQAKKDAPRRAAVMGDQHDGSSFDDDDIGF